MSKPTYDQLLGALEAVLPIAECHLNWLMTLDGKGNKRDAREADTKVSHAITIAERAKA